MSRDGAPGDGRPRTGTDELGDSTVMRLRHIAYRARRAGMWWTAGLVVLALVAGYLFGRLAGEEPAIEAAGQIEAELLPLVLDADGIWSSPSRETTSVSEAVVRLHQDDDADAIREYGDYWLEAYDTLLGRITATEVSVIARPVQRQFITGVTLSRDAVELLQRAAVIEDEQRRAALLVEVGRLRMRGEQIVQAGRASMADLGGDGGDVAPLPELPGFDEPNDGASP